MLQKLNERIQGVVAWIVIILIAVTFTLFGVDYYLQSRQTSDSEVTVNDESISKQAFEISYRRSRQQRDPAQLSAAADIALKKQVLDDMIVNLVTVQSARRGGFEVSSEQANAAIVAIPQFQQDGHFSTERYQQALSGAMFTPESFQKEVRQGMLLNQQRFVFIGSAFALPAEVKRFVKLYMQTRDYDYLQIPAALFIDKKQVTDEQIAQYYRAHSPLFVKAEEVKLAYVRLSMQQIRENLTVSEEDIQRYYADNQANYLTPAQWKVAHILFVVPNDADDEKKNEIKQQAEEAYQALQNNPAQFSQWVKTMSGDKLSLRNEGELPWISAGQTHFDKALSTLTRPGQIAAPLKTTHGYELFKLIAYKPAALKPLNEVKEAIKEQLLTELSQTHYTQALEQLTDLSYQAPDSLDMVAQSLKLPIETTESFSRAGGQTDLTKNKQVINTAFSHDVMELGNNSEPIQLDNDSVVVIRVLKHIPAVKQSVTEVKEKIINDLAKKQAEERAKELGKSLLSNTEQTVATVEGQNLVWHKVSDAARDSDKADVLINDLAFSLPSPNSRDGRKLMNGDFVIVRLKKISNGQYSKLDKEQQASLAQQIETSYGLMDYDLYINQLVNTAKIDRH